MEVRQATRNVIHQAEQFRVRQDGIRPKHTFNASFRKKWRHETQT